MPHPEPERAMRADMSRDCAQAEGAAFILEAAVSGASVAAREVDASSPQEQ